MLMAFIMHHQVGSMVSVQLWLFMTSSVSVSSGARIFLTSTQINSHIHEQLNLGEELVARGHEIFVAIGSSYPKLEAIKKMGIKPVTFEIPNDVLDYYTSEKTEKLIADQTFNKTGGKLEHMVEMSTWTNQICDIMMRDQVFMDRMKTLNFDLSIAEPFLFNPCPLILPQYLGVPFVSLTTFYMPWMIRSTALPSFYPRCNFEWDTDEEISFKTRFINFAMFVFGELYFPFRLHRNTTLLEVCTPQITSWPELVRQSLLYFIGNDHHLGSPIPAFPNFVSVAGMTGKSAKPLSDELESLAKSSEEGIILVSFGSGAYYFPDDIVVKLLQAFQKLNKFVIFAKFHIPKDVVVPNHVKILRWLPQNDILGHHRTKLFITHCGNNGQHEALYHGVPMIGFPLFAEQSQNCRRAKVKGFGLTMNIHNFTSEGLFDNVQEVLKTPKYASNIRRASEIFRSEPMSPQQRAVFWIEHVIKYGGKHLRSSATDLLLYQFFMLDVIGFLLAVLIIVCFTARFVILRICRACCKLAGRPGSKLKVQ